ncbi:uncharacterized protein LOC143452453 [Clavelina lepadiformis]|uniref:uncharacterized protein LOC143452453 n=1 Tax=Clavelina lepadiformis TaxID=159417 RepID=UPI0040430220
MGDNKGLVGYCLEAIYTPLSDHSCLNFMGGAGGTQFHLNPRINAGLVATNSKRGNWHSEIKHTNNFNFVLNQPTKLKIKILDQGYDVTTFHDNGAVAMQFLFAHRLPPAYLAGFKCANVKLEFISFLKE